MTRIITWTFVAALAGAMGARDAHAGEARGRVVCLAPMAPFDRDLLAEAGKGIQRLYGLDVRLLPARTPPRAAWYEPRRRWRAERVIESLQGDAGPGTGCDHVIAFTSDDISTTKGAIGDWGIFGLGEIGGRAAVVSTFRLGRGGVSRALLRERTVKVVNHELGHDLGLFHCPAPRCLMDDAEGSIRTVDREDGTLCDACRARLARRGLTVGPDAGRVDGSR